MNPAFFLEAEAATRRGPAHVRNEDAFIADVEAGLFAVADGMGGHREGHVASNATVTILERTFDREAPFEDKIETASQAIASINATLYAPSFHDETLDICGSTIVALIVDEGYACCLWVGDSRLYVFRQDELFLVSEDHAASDGMLTRAVGSAPTVEVERRILEIQEGDIFVLASDGLLKGTNEEQVATLLASDGDAPAERLLAKSITGGSPDDITVILVWVHALDD